RLEPLERRALRGTERERVLDYAIARARGPHLLAELGRRRHGEPLEVEEHRVRRLLELLVELVDQLLLLAAIHVLTRLTSVLRRRRGPPAPRGPSSTTARSTSRSGPSRRPASP